VAAPLIPAYSYFVLRGEVAVLASELAGVPLLGGRAITVTQPALRTALVRSPHWSRSVFSLSSLSPSLCGVSRDGRLPAYSEFLTVS